MEFISIEQAVCYSGSYFLKPGFALPIRFDLDVRVKIDYNLHESFGNR